MSLQGEKTLVAKIELEYNTYYVTDRYGITLDGNSYENVVTGWGDAQYIGNIGQNFEIGSFDVGLANGERAIYNGYLFDITDIWNNKIITVKKWSSGITAFDDCDPFVRGIIKGFSSPTPDSIGFTLDIFDQRDSKLLPSSVIEDQSYIADPDFVGRESANCLSGGLGGVTVDVPTIFSEDELIRLTNNEGDVEYVVVDSIIGNLVNFRGTANNSYNASSGGLATKAYIYVPVDNVGKTIPIQIGDLTDTINGVFGKTITINENIGEQAILTDTIHGNDINSIGIWEPGLQRYFLGRGNEGDSDDEYSIADNFSSIVFRIDSTTTLLNDILTTNDGVESIDITDTSLLQWVDETDVTDTDFPELLSVNVISIGVELMLLIRKPDETGVDNTVYVERGFSNSPITTHFAGDKVFQCAKYSAKNLITFTERFEGKSVYGMFFNSQIASKISQIVTGKWTNILNKRGDSNNFLRLNFENQHYVTFEGATFNFNLHFGKIEDGQDATVYNAYVAIDFDYSIDMTNSAQLATFTYIFLYDPAKSSDYDVSQPTLDTDHTYIYMDRVLANSSNSGSYNSFDTIERDSFNSGDTYIKPGINNDNQTISWDTGPLRGDPFEVKKLTDLNKKWKVHVAFESLDPSGGAFDGFDYTIRNIGVWLDFFVDFTQANVVSSLKGRVIDAAVIIICGLDGGESGNLLENPLDALAHLLVTELGYNSQEFVIANWTDVRDYYNTALNFGSSSSDIPKISFSYGIDDNREEGWKFCEWLASHFNLSIIKNYEGKINIINLHEIYYNTPSGYAIDIDDVLFLQDSGLKRLQMWQTGTDLIYNDFNIKWKRNNSTDEYQQVYKAPDDMTFQYSTNNLFGARNDFYNGKKRTLEIESPFIYQEIDAERKAEWEANDKAEVHFWCEFFLDFDHYKERQSPALTEQYKIGDIIYLEGKHGGLNLSSSNLWYINNITFTDSGREIKIDAKSLQPCTAFTITGTEENFLVYDTGGTTLTGDDIWNDTGGPGFTPADDIINDTGG